jgi:hypothetical protein
MTSHDVDVDFSLIFITSLTQGRVNFDVCCLICCSLLLVRSHKIDWKALVLQNSLGKTEEVRAHKASTEKAAYSLERQFRN